MPRPAAAWKRQRRGSWRATAGLGVLAAAAAAAAVIGLPSITRDALRRGADPLVSSGAGAPAVAVLRLHAVGPHDARGWLAEALHVGLVDALSHSRGLVVRSREAVAAQEAAALSPDGLARVLGVTFLVGGSIAVWNDELVLTVQLSDASGARFVGSRSFRAVGEPTSLATIEELTNRAAEYLLGRVGGEVRVRTWRAATADAEAFRLRFQAAELETRARELIQVREYAAAERTYVDADSLLAAAVARAPDWAEARAARAALADRRAALAMEAGHGAEAAMHFVAEGIRHANALLRRNPDDAAGMALRGTLGWSLIRYATRYRGGPGLDDAPGVLDAAEADLRRALALDPTLASAAATLSDLLMAERMAWGESRVFALQALERDAYLENTSVVVQRIAVASFEMGEDSAALVWCRTGLRRFPDAARHHACVLDVWGWGEVAVEPDTAWAYYHRLIELTPEPFRWSVETHYGTAVAAALARSGHADSAQRVFGRAWRAGLAIPGDPSREDARRLWLEAALRYRLGDVDSAVVLVERYRRAAPAESEYLLRRRMLRPVVERQRPPSPD